MSTDKMIDLPNGEKVEVETICQLRKALVISSAAVAELALKVQNPEHKIIPTDYCSVLKNFRLMDDKGEINPDVMKVMGICYIDDGFGITLLPPLAPAQ